jgi:CHAT domain-containing protein/Tfp pilus assembly protein PilF
MHRSALVYLFLFLTLTVYAQQNRTGKTYQALYGHAEKLFHLSGANESTDSLALSDYIQVASILRNRKLYNDTLVDVYLKSGILKMSENQFEQAIRYFHDAIFAVSENHRLSDSLLFKPYLYAGSVHYNLNNLDSAIEYYKKAEAINSRHTGLSESERLFNKFGALYYETGDYDKSISYFEKALSLVEKKKPLNVYFVINYKNNIATALMKLGKYERALDILKDLLQYDNPGDELLYNTGNAYFEMKNYAQALKYLEKIRTLEFEKLSSLIKVFVSLRQYDSAGFYLAKAERWYSDKRNYVPRVTRGIVMKYSGDLKAATGQRLEAIHDYQQAIIYLDPAFKDTSLTSNPASFSGLLNFLYLFDALIAKARTFRLLNTSGDTYLIQSLNAYSSALSLANHIEKTYFSDDARLFLKNKVNPATQEAFDVSIRLFDITKNPRFMNEAFGIAENNKASVLQAGLRKLELSSIPELPAALVAEEKKFRTALAKLNIQSTQATDSLSFSNLQGKIHDVEISLAAVQDKLDENPVYHSLKFYSLGVNIDSLRMKIPDADEAILTYYYTSADLICFYISKEGSGFTSVPLHANIFSAIVSLRKELQAPDASSGRYLEEVGSVLFRELVAPVYEKIKNKRRLVIIPFNEISYVPFDMLKNPADGSFLLRKFAISYNYSASFLSDTHSRPGISYSVLGMAPFSGKSAEGMVLPPLPSSVDEIFGLPGKTLTGAGASKAKFISLSGQFPIVHLATHAVANDTNLLGSYIEFYGLKNDADSAHRLYEQEIYTLDMKSARLVILSACETGNGMLVNGEGIMSLSRALSYAGCKTTVTSLWKADDKSTSFIAKRIHHYLQKGIDIDVALQLSKIDYLESNQVNVRLKSPAYWAHLVLIGDFHRVVEPGFNWALWLGIAGILMLIVTYAGIKKTGHKNARTVSLDTH